MRYLHVDAACAAHLCKVAHTAQQGVGNTWCATAARGDFTGGIDVAGHTEQRGRAQDNLLQHRGVVVFEVHVDAETGSQRSREQAAAGGGTYEREGVEVDLNRAGRRTFVNHDVDAIVLHSRVEVLLDHGREAVYLVDEQHVVLFERGEDAGQVAGLVEHGAAGHLEPDTEFVGDDVRQRRLAQSWGAVQKRVVERFAAELRCLDKDAQVLDHLCLTAEVGKPQRAQGILEVFFLRRQVLLFADVKIFVHSC